LVILFGEVGDDVAVVVVLDRLRRHLAGRRDLAAPAEPDARMALEGGADSDLQPPGPAAAIAGGNRHAVGDYDKPGQFHSFRRGSCRATTPPRQRTSRRASCRATTSCRRRTGSISVGMRPNGSRFSKDRTPNASREPMAREEPAFAEPPADGGCATQRVQCAGTSSA